MPRRGWTGFSEQGRWGRLTEQGSAPFHPTKTCFAQHQPPPYQEALTRKYFSKRTLEVLKVPRVSISITVLKALKDRALAGHRKFPAAPEDKQLGSQSALGGGQQAIMLG